MRKIILSFRRFLLGAFFGTISLGAPIHAAETDMLKRIGSQIERHHVVHADFTQTKQMAALKRPLITTGHLVFLREQGVLWQIEKPYRIAYLLSDEKIVEIAADGSRKERGQRDVPGLAQIGRVFHAMLGAQTNILHEYFNVSVEGNEKKWRITLTPRHPQIAQFLTQLRLNGGQFVEQIRILEAGGDTTLIRFTNSRGSKIPSESDKRLFEQKPG